MLSRHTQQVFFLELEWSLMYRTLNIALEKIKNQMKNPKLTTKQNKNNPKQTKTKPNKKTPANPSNLYL